MKLSIVSYLDDKSSRVVREIQRDLSDITGSKGSLEAWEPHVTIGDGVEVNGSELEQLKAALHLLADQTSSFDLTLRGIGSLDDWRGGAEETPYVIYIDVVLNDNLTKLVDAMDAISSSYNKWYAMPRPYLPHCTLAFRDLSKEGYNEGLEYLSGIRPHISAQVDHIALVEKLPATDRELVRFKLAP